jgi:outer membrane protein assembly factor BamB
MKKLLLLLPAFAFTFYSCGDKPAEAVKADTVDTAAIVKVLPVKPVELIDPNDTVFDWVTTVPLHVSYASDFLVLPGGNIIFTTEDKDSCIRIVDRKGNVVRSFGQMGRTDSTFKNSPNYMAMGPGGRVYVSDGIESRVLVFDTTGKFIQLIKIKGGDLIAGITVNKAGTLFVSSATGWMLKAYDASGNFVRDMKEIRSKGGVAWGYFASVRTDSSDRLYVCNWRDAGSGGSDVVVHECDKDGAYLATIPLLLDHGVVMFTVDPVGRLFADALDGVVVYNREGRRISKIGKIGKGDGEFEKESIAGIRVDNAGYVYVLCNKEIKIFR